MKEVKQVESIKILGLSVNYWYAIAIIAGCAVGLLAAKVGVFG